MTGFWPAIWSSPGRATAAGAVISALIASVLYAVNWHTFYDTRTLEARQDAGRIAEDIAVLAAATGGVGTSYERRFQSALRDFLSSRHARVTVHRRPHPATGESGWTLSNDAPVDATRTQLEEHFAQAQGTPGELSVTVQEGIRPSLATALIRAWTFSLVDYFDSPAQWWSRALYNRSVPLYGYLLTVVIVGFGTVRALYRDQQEFQRLDGEGRRITAELGALRQTHVQELEALQGQMADIQIQREEARRERDRLLGEIEGIDSEYRDLVEGAPSRPGEETVAVRLRDNAARRSEARLALASYNERVTDFESELARAQAEMQAAEHLVHEVDEKREDLLTKLRDRNREIRKLQSLVQQAQKETHTLQLNTARQQPPTGDPEASQPAQGSVEAQALQWVRTSGEAKVSFSSHSRAAEVEQRLKRIDRGFLDRFFTHVVNPEYERGAHRLIRVNSVPGEGADGGHGELVVALDDDAGRTLGLRFSTRTEAPDTVQVGFVLALLLRSHCRDFRSFAIRTR